MILIKLILLLIFCWLLIKAVDALIAAVTRLAEISRMGQFALSTVVLALATSIPELVVSLTAALSGSPNMALGTVIGSNIADISLVVGGAAVVGGGFSVAGSWLKIDIFSIFLAGALPLVLLLDNRLSRSDGLILLAVFGLYNYGVIRMRPASRHQHSRLLRPLAEKNNWQKLEKTAVKLAIAVIGLIVSAEAIVRLAVDIAQGLNISVFLIGLFLVAVGSSLPELSFEIESIRQRKIGMALGDLFGSVVANSTLILGLVAVIRPIYLTNGWQEYGLAAASFGVVFILFWALVRSKMKLERWEGAALLVFYLIFAILEFSR